MTGTALLLAAEHADPQVAAREARRRLGSTAKGVDDEAVVAAVVAEGFTEQTAREAVRSTTDRDEAAPTRSCASGVELSASDD